MSNIIYQDPLSGMDGGDVQAKYDFDYMWHEREIHTLPAYDIHVDMEEDDYENYKYEDFKELYCFVNDTPIDKQGNNIVWDWYRYEDKGVTYYEYSSFDGVAGDELRTIKTLTKSPYDRLKGDYSTVDLRLCVGRKYSASGDDGLDLEEGETVTVAFCNKDALVKYRLELSARDLDKYGEVEVLVPSGNYTVYIEKMPFEAEFAPKPTDIRLNSATEKVLHLTAFSELTPLGTPHIPTQEEILGGKEMGFGFGFVLLSAGLVVTRMIGRKKA